MNNEKAELISALADDHLQGREREAALTALRDERHLRERWERYHLIGDLVRGEIAPRDGVDLAERIREQLESEPVHLAPRRRITPAVGWAMAASALLAAVLFVATSPFDPVRAPVAVATNPPPPAAAVVAQGEWERLDERELAPYLVNHHAYATTLAVPASVRIVSHEAGR